MVTDLLMASRNAKKLAELHRVLDAAGVSGLRLLSRQLTTPKKLLVNLYFRHQAITDKLIRR